MATVINYKLQVVFSLFLIFLYPLTGCSKQNIPEKSNDFLKDPTLPLFYVTGNQFDVKSKPIAGIVLAGGGTDNDNAMKWMLKRADGGDVVVIRSSGGDGYNRYFYKELGVAVNSVTTIVIDSREKANNNSVFNTLRRAELLFIAGGDQNEYIRFWQNTKVDSAINYLVNTKKITIGGTSAGMAILSKFCYTGSYGSVTSKDALSNPYHYRITIKKSFTQLDLLKNTITDTHFSQRNRQGRLLTFLARIARENNLLPKGIAADEESALCVDEQGVAKVFGGKVFFYKAVKNLPQTCLPHTSLTWEDADGAIAVYTMDEDKEVFDMHTWSSPSAKKWKKINIVSGSITSVD